MSNLFLHYFLFCVSKRGHQSAPASTPPPNTSSYTGRTLVHHVFHAVVHSMHNLVRTKVYRVSVRVSKAK